MQAAAQLLVAFVEGGQWEQSVVLSSWQWVVGVEATHRLPDNRETDREMHTT